MVEKVTGSIFTRYEKSARSQQGMAIWRDEAFLYYHGGSCDVMDLKEKKIVGHFLPESYTGEGSGDPYINHANQALFLKEENNILRFISQLGMMEAGMRRDIMADAW